MTDARRGKRVAFALATIAAIGMQLVAIPTVQVVAIAPAEYYGPPAAGTFTYNRNTTYLYNFSYTISTTSGLTFNTQRWIPMVTNRTLLAAGGTVYEQEFVTTNVTHGSSVSHGVDVDVHGNEFHVFNLSIPVGTSWNMNVQGRLTLRDVTWKAQSGVTMASYNTTDGLYSLYTLEEQYINKSYAPIVAAAASCYSASPWTTIQNVYTYVKNHLTYTAQTEERGAEWAIDNGQGDCTEYSYLMVALLRACGIPARVMRGIVIADSAGAAVSPDYDAAVGKKWRFAFETTGEALTKDNLTGHAWVEYFVPNAGWVLSDPTWHAAGDYVSRIDNIHVPYTTSLWLGDGLTYELPEEDPTVELSTIPYPFYIRVGVNQAARYDFTVLAQQAPPPWWEQVLDFLVKNPLVIVGIVAFIVLLVVVSAVRKRRRNKDTYGDNASRERLYFNT